MFEEINQPRISADFDYASTFHSCSSVPAIIEVSRELCLALPAVRAALDAIDGNLSSVLVQQTLRRCLMEISAWSEWIAANPLAPPPRPTLLKAGLGTELDDEHARKLLVGVALCLQPQHLVPPYAIGNQAVTEVIAQPQSTKESHSMNDLPAPPHTAGFFEDVPPHTCYFSCIRPHAGGGAETTVLDLERVLAHVPQALIDEWSSKSYYLKTSRRMGEEVRPFQLLRWVDGVPFLRYRKEYMLGFEHDPSLKILEELVSNPANHFVVALKPGETLIHWNGAPHSRLAQQGDTPEPIAERRKLIRCRTVPTSGWGEQF